MKRILALVLVVAMVMSTTGCANGPIGRFFRGGACSTCTPPSNRLFNWRGNTASDCASGNCPSAGMNDPYQMAPAVIGSGIQNQPGTVPGNLGTYPYPSGADFNNGFVNPPVNQQLPGPTGGGQ